MKIVAERLCRVWCPPHENVSDMIQLDWLMNRFGLDISNELIWEMFMAIVKEFQRNPSPNKDLKFTLLCEEIKESRDSAVS